jgi:HK97 family phage major capsid protein
MSDILEIKAAVGELAHTVEAFKEANDERLSLLEKKRSDVVLEEKVDRMNGAITGLQDSMSSIKTALKRPMQGSHTKHDAEPSEHKRAFLRYISKGTDSDLGAIEAKAMSVVSDPDGGYLVPNDMTDRIITRQFDTTPMRQLATIMTVNSDAIEILRDTDDTEAQWVSELDNRLDTEPGQFGRVRISVHELHAQPKATQKLLDDANLNVEEWIVNKIAARFARRENAAFVTGDGVAQPRGFGSYPVAATTDTTRPWGTFEYFPSGAAGAFAAAAPADAIISLMHRLKAGYLPKAAWLMPRAVSELIRKMKGTTNDSYLWQPSLQIGTPATLLGFPVYLGEDMPAVAANSLSLAFGDFGEGYTIVDRIGMRVLRDPYTAAPFVKFRCTKRVGGDVTNFDALKFLRFSVS